LLLPEVPEDLSAPLETSKPLGPPAVRKVPVRAALRGPDAFGQALEIQGKSLPKRRDSFIANVLHNH
ncbi:hypothetical protein, partial [Klebsiella pneumoniae]|uniref:hypothetical protein n=1 Tax=Klebsiella pneumoniae TaxID=573 RepID=UPI001C72456D